MTTKTFPILLEKLIPRTVDERDRALHMFLLGGFVAAMATPVALFAYMRL
jgi:hypothetical protein